MIVLSNCAKFLNGKYSKDTHQAYYFFKGEKDINYKKINKNFVDLKFSCLNSSSEKIFRICDFQSPFYYKICLFGCQEIKPIK